MSMASSSTHALSFAIRWAFSPFRVFLFLFLHSWCVLLYAVQCFSLPSRPCFSCVQVTAASHTVLWLLCWQQVRTPPGHPMSFPHHSRSVFPSWERSECHRSLDVRSPVVSFQPVNHSPHPPQYGCVRAWCPTAVLFRGHWDVEAL